MVTEQLFGTISGGAKDRSPLIYRLSSKKEFKILELGANQLALRNLQFDKTFERFGVRIEHSDRRPINSSSSILAQGP